MTVPPAVRDLAQGVHELLDLPHPVLQQIADPRSVAGVQQFRGVRPLHVLAEHQNGQRGPLLAQPHRRVQPLVGQRVRVWLGDGTRKSLRIAAVMATGTGNNGVYVTPRNAPGATVDRVDVALAAGADGDAVAAGLRAAVHTSGGLVLTKDQWVRASYPGTNRTTRLGLLLVLGIALLCTGISLANTMVMATSDRVRDLAVLRLAGATRWQVLRLVGADALTVVAVGGVLGLLVAGLNLLGMWGALDLLSVPSTIEIPWTAMGAAVGACAVLAVVSSVVPASLALRRRAVELAGVRE